MAEKMTIKDLTDAYNAAAKKLGRPTVKRFRDRKAAETRTKEILEELQARKPGRKSGPVNWPYRGALHTPREGSLSCRIRDALKDGATMDQLSDVVAGFDAENGNPPKDLPQRARFIMRDLHRYHGYGVRQKGETFKLVTR